MHKTPASHPCSSFRSAFAEPLERRRLLAAGDPDLTFSAAGVATLDQFPGEPIIAYDVALQPDGKMVVAGYQEGLYCAARLNVDGSVDSSFGNGGVWAFPTSIVGSGGQPQVALQPDGKIIVAGPRYTGIEPVFAVARLTADGLPDFAFGSGGFVHTNIGAGEHPADVIVQQDGKIVVVGYAQIGGDVDFVITRYHTSGVNEFVRTIGFGSDEFALAVAIDYTGTPATNPLYGSIVAAGRKGDDFAVARLTPAGQLDGSLDGDGKLTTSFPGRQAACRAVVIQPGGKIVVVGSSVNGSIDSDVAMTRYLWNGAMDTSFGTDGTGRVETDLGGWEHGNAAAAGFTGGILVAGDHSDGSSYVGTVFAYTSDGRLDTRYGGGGVVFTNADPWLGIATTGDNIAPIRRLVVVGLEHAARYIDVGSLVAVGSFDPNGSEAGQEPAHFLVGRTVALPYAERVYLNVSGSARAPYLLNADYTVSGMTIEHPFQGRSYVDIPANQTVASVTITPINDTLVEGDETIVMSIASDDSYDIGTPPSTTLAIRDNDVVGGPVVASSQFLFETAPQRVLFTFNQDVGSSISANDFQVSGPPGTPAFSFAYDSIANTATLSFSAILPDGDYTTRAIAAGITNGTGQPMPADHVLDFFFLNGDANHDGSVNSDDFNILATNFGLSGKTLSQGNFDYDALGLVNSDDFNILAGRFGFALGPQAFAQQPMRPGERHADASEILDELT
jgi:uncharacterized delta-60 repeat protein